MFGRTVTFGVAALVLGALGVVAQTADQAYRDKLRLCGASVFLVDFQSVYKWEYDDSTYYKITYPYNPTYCDATMTVNSIELIDYANGGSSPCTRQQFSADRTSIYSECRVFNK